MRQCGGFYIKTEKENRESMLSLVKEFLSSVKFESDDFWSENLTESLYVDYETFIDYRDYDSNNGFLFVNMCKHIATQMPNVYFEGISHYCNENAGFNMDCIVKYHGKRSMRTYTIEYYDGEDDPDTLCPDCESPIFLFLWDGFLNPVIPNHAYCTNCNKQINFKDIAKTKTIKI